MPLISIPEGEKEVLTNFIGQLLQGWKVCMLYADAQEACSAVGGVLIL